MRENRKENQNLARKVAAVEKAKMKNLLERHMKVVLRANLYRRIKKWLPLKARKIRTKKMDKEKHLHLTPQVFHQVTMMMLLLASCGSWQKRKLILK